MQGDILGITICFINQKGGCGKSSTCFHLAGHLAQSCSRVLLIDADPQGSLSQGFLGSHLVECLEPSETLAALFRGDVFVGLETLVTRTPIDNIQLVPANQHLATYNIPSPEELGLQQFTLASLLEQTHDYDVTLIDCPPNLYACSWNALLAADYVVIPVPPEDFGTQGLRAVHQAIEQAGKLNPKLMLLGLLVTRMDRRLLVHRAYEQKLRRLYGEIVFETVVPEAAAFKVALACRQPVSHYSSRSGAAAAVAAMATEMRDRIHRQHNCRSVA